MARDTGLVYTLKIIPSMTTAVILALKNGKGPYCGITAAKRSGIKSIAVQPKPKTHPPVPELRSRP